MASMIKTQRKINIMYLVSTREPEGKKNIRSKTYLWDDYHESKKMKLNGWKTYEKQNQKQSKFDFSHNNVHCVSVLSE